MKLSRIGVHNSSSKQITRHSGKVLPGILIGGAAQFQLFFDPPLVAVALRKAIGNWFFGRNYYLCISSSIVLMCSTL